MDKKQEDSEKYCPQLIGLLSSQPFRAGAESHRVLSYLLLAFWADQVSGAWVNATPGLFFSTQKNINETSQHHQTLLIECHIHLGCEVPVSFSCNTNVTSWLCSSIRLYYTPGWAGSTCPKAQQMVSVFGLEGTPPLRKSISQQWALQVSGAPMKAVSGIASDRVSKLGHRESKATNNAKKQKPGTHSLQLGNATFHVFHHTSFIHMDQAMSSQRYILLIN